MPKYYTTHLAGGGGPVRLRGHGGHRWGIPGDEHLDAIAANPFPPRPPAPAADEAMAVAPPAEVVADRDAPL